MEREKGYTPRVETKLKRSDFERVDELARLEKKTKAEVVREAVLWYIDHKEELRNSNRDTVTAKSIDAMTNRMCAMLARQGRLMATLFELTYANLSQTDEGKEAFAVALKKAKQKMAQGVERDEREVVESMRRTMSA